MNLKNLERVRQFGASFDLTGGHMSITTAIRKTRGYALPHSWEDNETFTPETRGLTDAALMEFIESDKACLLGARFIFDTVRIEHQMHEVAADKRLSAAGIEERLAATRAAAAKALVTHEAQLRTHSAEVAGRVTKHYEPAQIPKGDIESALLDQEARGYWRALPDKQRLDTLVAMEKAGAHDRLLLALQRSVVPMESREDMVGFLGTAWRASVARRDPQGTALVNAAEANAAWARHIADATPTYALPLLGSQKEIYAAVRDVPGASKYLGIDEGASQAYEHQLQRQAA